MSRKIVIACGSLIALLALVGVGYSIYQHHDAQERTVVGLFADANPIGVGDDVRAAGVRVGRVTAINLTRGVAAVSMSIDPSVLPLHDDASLVLRPINILGNDYIELNPGTPERPEVLQPATIPLSRTKSSVTLQDVFNTFNDPTATALSASVTALGDGLQGNGQKASAAIAGLKPAFDQFGKLGALLSSQDRTLKQLLDQVQPIADSLATNNGKSLDQVVDSTRDVLAAAASQNRELDSSLGKLPGTLSVLHGSLANIGGLSDSGARDLRSVRPVTDRLTDISQQLNEFGQVANPALDSLTPVLKKSDDLMDQLKPLASDLRPTARNLEDVSRPARPVLGTVAQSYDNIMDFVRWWAMANRGYDALSHYFRGMVVFTPRSLATLPEAALPGDNPITPPANKALDQIGHQALPMLGGPPSDPKNDPANATGLSKQQESGLLGEVFGGDGK